MSAILDGDVAGVDSGEAAVKHAATDREFVHTNRNASMKAHPPRGVPGVAGLKTWGDLVDIMARGRMARNFDRITQDPAVLAGRASIRGLRISVAHVVNLVANGMTAEEIVHELPDLDEADIRQALAYAAALAEDERYPLRA